jgi:hypothetical protein
VSVVEHSRASKPTTIIEEALGQNATECALPAIHVTHNADAHFGGELLHIAKFSIMRVIPCQGWGRVVLYSVM